MKQVALALSSLVLIGILVSACAPAPTPAAPAGAATSVVPAQPAKGGTLVIADSGSSVTLDPILTTWWNYAHYALFSTLLQHDMKGELTGYLAKSWEGSEDGKLVTIKLIENAKFSDGTPVDAEAIKWNLMTYGDPKVASPGGGDLVGLLTNIEVVDKYTLKITLDHPFAPFFNLLSQYYIVSPAAYQKYGKDFGTHPVGAGPFVFKELVGNTSVTLERNPDFKWAPKGGLSDHDGPVYLDKVIIKYIPEQQTVLSALQTGEIQFAKVPPQNLKDVQKDPNIQVQKQMLNEIRYLGFNTSKAPWDNADLRRALAYAVNRDEYVKLAWDGVAEPLYGPLPPTIWGYYPEIKSLAAPYDPAKAKQLLDGLGYKDVNNDGYREDPQGKPWSAKLSTVSDDIFKRQAEVLQAQFRDVGFKVDIDLMEMSALTSLTTTGKHELFLLRYQDTDPNILTFFFDPKRIGKSNRAWYNNPQLADLLVKSDADLNAKTRLETVKQIQQVVVKEAPWIPLCVPYDLFGVRNELKGWKLHPDAFAKDFLYFDAYFDVNSK